MTKILAFIIMLVGIQGMAAVPFERDGKWGYRDMNGEIIIEAQYIMAGAYSPEWIAPVVDEKGWAYINKTGTVVIRPYVYGNGPDPFSEGLARYSENRKFGFFDKTGRVAIKAAFDFAFPFKEGMARVCNECNTIQDGEHSYVEGGTWGFIDKQGTIIVPVIFEHASDFDKGRAQVVFKGKKIYIDREGKNIQ